MPKKMKKDAPKPKGAGVVKMGKDKVFTPFEDKIWYKAKYFSKT